MQAGGVGRFERLTVDGAVTYQPGLDGLRGMAVLAVVLFHLDVAPWRGGYLGVSLFFTLSGFLIGTIVLSELTTTGRFAAGRFWRRRARRLLPAALVTLAAVALGRLLTDHLDGTSGTDLMAAGLDVANWQLLAGRVSYADLFGAPSAVLHYWSLSIEEQFYLLGGIVMLGVTRVCPRRPAAVIGTGAAAIATVSFALPAIAGFGVDRTYYGTDTRAGELMVGVALAAWCAGPARRTAIVGHGRLLAHLAAAAATATVVLWVTQDPATEALRRGLLPASAVLSAALIVGALLPGGPVAAACAMQPLRAIGRVSYAWYLVHWPVIVVANRVTDDRSLLRSLALAVGTLMLAAACTAIVERPIRTRRVSPRPLAILAAAVLATITAGVVLDARRTPTTDLLTRLGTAAPLPTGDLDAVGDTDAGTPGAGSRPRLVVLGDSIGLSLVLATGQAAVAPSYDMTRPGTDLGCGVALSPWPPVDDPHRCDDPVERFSELAAESTATDALVVTCQWELLDQELPAAAGDDGRVRHIGDPVLDRYVLDRFAAVVDGLRGAGVQRVLWSRCPYFGAEALDSSVPSALREARSDERVDAFNAVLDELAASRHDVVLLPLDGWVNAHRNDAAIRPDGAHYEYERPNSAADELLRLVNAALADGPPARTGPR